MQITVSATPGHAQVFPDVVRPDGDQLVNMVLQHYEQFDSKYKGIMPLKRVYVPEPLEESD